MSQVKSNQNTLVLVALVTVVLAVSGHWAAAAADVDRQEAREQTIERPSARATSFVPRLGKRANEPLVSVDLRLDQALCLTYGLECDSLSDALLAAAYSRATRLGNSRELIELAQGFDGASGEQVNPAGNSNNLARIQQWKRSLDQELEQRAAAEQSPLGRNGVGSKRVAFTPRIG